MNITKGRVQRKKKVVIYGPEGIGKSTLASKFPDPLFIDTEGGTANLDIQRFDGKPSSWAALGECVKYVADNKCCQTLVIDTMDWAEQLLVDNILHTHQKKGIEDFGYGSGYVYVAEGMKAFLNTLQTLIDNDICNVVLLCHSQTRKFELPNETGSFDRYELKLGKKTGSQTAPLVKEWADMILFCNYEMHAVATDKEGKKFKGRGGERVMFTTHHPCWDAKNRFGLAEKIPLDYGEIKAVIEGGETPKKKVEELTPDDFLEVKPDISDKLPEALKDLMMQNDVKAAEIQLAVAQKGYFPEKTPIENYPADFINGVLVGAWEQVFDIIKHNRDELPF
jgi:hypothetical protein